MKLHQESDTLVTYVFDSIFAVNSFHTIHSGITMGDISSIGCDTHNFKLRKSENLIQQ